MPKPTRNQLLTMMLSLYWFAERVAASNLTWSEEKYPGAPTPPYAGDPLPAHWDGKEQYSFIGSTPDYVALVGDMTIHHTGRNVGNKMAACMNFEALEPHVLIPAIGSNSTVSPVEFLHECLIEINTYYAHYKSVLYGTGGDDCERYKEFFTARAESCEDANQGNIALIYSGMVVIGFVAMIGMCFTLVKFHHWRHSPSANAPTCNATFNCWPALKASVPHREIEMQVRGDSYVSPTEADPEAGDIQRGNGGTANEKSALLNK
jgi:hypothetical protein